VARIFASYRRARRSIIRTRPPSSSLVSFPSRLPRKIRGSSRSGGATRARRGLRASPSRAWKSGVEVGAVGRVVLSRWSTDPGWLAGRRLAGRTINSYGDSFALSLSLSANLVARRETPCAHILPSLLPASHAPCNIDVRAGSSLSQRRRLVLGAHMHS
jgi:hypothetical protein